MYHANLRLRALAVEIIWALGGIEFCRNKRKTQIGGDRRRKPTASDRDNHSFYGQADKQLHIVLLLVRSFFFLKDFFEKTT